jgi:hypothetical protein
MTVNGSGLNAVRTYILGSSHSTRLDERVTIPLLIEYRISHELKVESQQYLVFPDPQA